jgi:mRNA-degrading endonuclease RelE of RelBE toxin-antitoxin system
LIEIVESVPWRSNEYPITVVELKSATKDLERFLSQDEIVKLIDFLAFNPDGGEVIPETGGVRKTRWRFRHKGKSTGLRIIYYFHDLNMPLYVLAVYSKGEVLRLTKKEELEMRKLVKALVHENAERLRRSQGYSA